MTAARRQPGELMRRHRGARAVAINASPTHEPRHAANYGDGWHPLNAPRLKPEARSPLPPCAKGRQDTQAGSTQCEAMR